MNTQPLEYSECDVCGKDIDTDSYPCEPYVRHWCPVDMLESIQCIDCHDRTS